MKRTLYLVGALLALGVALVWFDPPARALVSIVASGGSGGGASYAPVSNTTCSAFSGTTVTCTITGATAGNAILGMVSMQPSATTLSVSAGCTLGATATGGSSQIAALYCLNIASGSVATTITSTATITNGEMEVEQWSGVATSSAHDGDNAAYTAGSTGTNLPCGSGMTTTANGDLIWAEVFQAQSVAPTLGSGFTANKAASPWWSEYKTQATSGAITPNFTGGTNSFDNWVVCLAMK